MSPRPGWSRLRAVLPQVRVPRPARSASSTPAATLGNGIADPGEVVWAWVPYEEDAQQGKDRPVLVLAVEDGQVLALPMTSKDHDRDAAQEASVGRHWLDIGSGPWDSRRRASEVRLDRVVRIPGDRVRREGAALDPGLFQQVLEAHRDVTRS